MANTTVNYGFLSMQVLGPTKLIVSVAGMLPKTYTIDQGTGPVNINLGDNQFTTIHLQAVDAAGLPSALTTPAAWTCSDSTIVLITPSADGTSCRVEAAIPAKLGTAAVSVTDTSLPNAPPLTFSVIVAAEAASALGATVDAPTERPAPAPPAGP